MNVRITLQSKNKNDTLCFDIKPNATAIGQKWFDKLSNILESNLEIEKNFCWVGFPDNPRQLPFLCQNLSYFIEKINSFSQQGGWGGKTYEISEVYTPETVIVNGVYNQDIMNAIHHHFEILQGQSWKISDWFLTANDEVRFAIRQLNNLCHEIEILIKAIEIKEKNIEQVSPATIVSFINSPRFDLEPDDYNHFTLNRGIGKVFMHYCQIGKTHYEAFVDNDQMIYKDNITGLRFYSGEFNIDWGPTFHDGIDWWVQKKQTFDKWLLQNGYDPANKFISKGWLEIGHVQLDPLYELSGGQNISDIHKLLSNYLDIVKIETISESQTVSNHFTTNWTDDNFLSSQFSTLSESYHTFCENSDHKA